MLEFCYKMYIF